MAGVSLHSITKRFGDAVAVDGVSLDIRDGEFLTLVGPSGCGKSTLLRIIAGLEGQTSGLVSIGGMPVDALRPKQRDVAMVFQSYALYPYMTAAQNMALPLVMRRLSRWQRLPLLGRMLPGTKASRRAIDGDVKVVAETLDIAHLMHRKPGQLSGGQRQRVAVGRAMVRHPAVFLMDEPLSNLDAKLRVQMRAEIAELHRRLGVTFIYVTHDQAEAMTMSDRVAVMRDGLLLQVAAPQDIYAHPADIRVASFIGSPRINCLAGTARSDGAVDVHGATLPGPPALPAGSSVTVGVRPEGFAIAENSGPETITGRIRTIEHLGSDLFVHLDLPAAGEPVIVRTEPGMHSRLHHGEELHISAATGGVLLFDGDGRRVSPPAATAVPLRSFA